MAPSPHLYCVAPKRIASFFETAAPKYDWLNRLLAVGIGHRTADGPIYSLFELL